MGCSTEVSRAEEADQFVGSLERLARLEAGVDLAQLGSLNPSGCPGDQIPISEVYGSPPSESDSESPLAPTPSKPADGRSADAHFSINLERRIAFRRQFAARRSTTL